MTVRRLLPVVAALAVVVGGCTGGSRGGPVAGGSSAADRSGSATPSAAVSSPDAASPSAVAPASTMCPAPVLLDAAPTDFPHPTLTRYPVDPATQAADEQLVAQGLAATRTFGGPVSTTAFQHYVDATGEYLTLPVDRLLTANPALVDELNRRLVAAAADAVQQVRSAEAATCVSVPFASDWVSYGELAAGDWYYTLGTFTARVLGTATRAAPGAGDVRVTYRAAIGDTYDFDPGSTFEQFGRLALHGRAADFLTGGLTTTRSATVRADASELATPGFG